MIFCAGFGTRMRHLTKQVPKPLLPVAGVSLFDRAVHLARAANVHDIVVNAHYLADKMEAEAIDAGVRISREEPDILDTGGGLKAAAAHMGDAPIYTANPDVIWNGPNPYDVLAEAWSSDMGTLLLCVPVDRAIGRKAGDFDVETPGSLRRPGQLVYGGMQIIHPNLVTAVQKRVFSLNEVWTDLSDKKQAHIVEYPGQWCDVGDPDGIRRAEDLLAASHNV